MAVEQVSQTKREVSSDAVCVEAYAATGRPSGSTEEAINVSMAAKLPPLRDGRVGRFRESCERSLHWVMNHDDLRESSAKGVAKVFLFAKVLCKGGAC